MSALLEAFAKAKSKDSASVVQFDSWEAEALGISVEKMKMWKQGFHDTYEVAKVKTLEHGLRMPVKLRSGWRNCGNY